MAKHFNNLDELSKRISYAEKIEEILFRNGEWQIHATYGTLSTHCPTCNCQLTHHDWSNSRYLDAPNPTSRERVYLHVKRPRYRCKACQKTLTPVILDVIENYRVTNRLIDYIKNNLWLSNSLRELAGSVGSTAKTISQVLKTIADTASKGIDGSFALGIHELILKKQRHLILSNLFKGTVVGFLPDSPNQLDHLISQLICFNKISPIQILFLPADQIILKKVVPHIPATEIGFSLSSINSVLARSIIKQSGKSSKKGKLGSVSRNEAHRIAYIRKAELAENDISLFLDGIQTKNEFWEIYEAKEQLLSHLEGTKDVNWIETYRCWMLTLPLHLSSIFYDVSLLFNEMARLQVKLSLAPVLEIVDKNVLLLQKLLLKPGKSFSPEMISALVLASPFLGVPLERKVGMKGSGPLWLEISEEEENFINPNSAGISLISLVSMLTRTWNISETHPD